MRNEVIVGIDPSTRTGVVVLEVQEVPFQKEQLLVVSSGVVRCNGKDSAVTENRIRRAHEIANYVTSQVVASGARLAVIEGYGYANTSTLATLVEIGFLIRYSLWRAGVPFLEVSPTGLKKFVAGSGSSKKDVMLLSLYKRWGFEVEDNDVGDALGLALVGAGVLGLLKELLVTQKEVVEVLKKAMSAECKALVNLSA